MAMRVKLDIENRTIIRIAVLIALGWISVQIFSEIQHALLLVVIAFFFTLALARPVNYIASRITKGKGGRVLPTGIAYLGVLLVVGTFIYLTFPPIVKETTNLINAIPEMIEGIRDEGNGGMFSELIDRHNLQDEVDGLVADISSELTDIASPVVAGAERVAGGIVSVFIVLVLTFFMLVEGPAWMKRFWTFTPKSKLAHNQELALQMQRVVTGYVNGQFIVALMAGTSSLIMMLIVGLPSAIALAGVVAMFALIPLIGAIMGSVVVILVALTQSLVAALIMLVFFVVYQQIENNTVQPYIQSRVLHLSPLLILVSVMVGFALGGILGGFLAIPTVAAGRILLEDYLGQRKLPQDQ